MPDRRPTRRMFFSGGSRPHRSRRLLALAQLGFSPQLTPQRPVQRHRERAFPSIKRGIVFRFDPVWRSAPADSNYDDCCNRQIPVIHQDRPGRAGFHSEIQG